MSSTQGSEKKKSFRKRLGLSSSSSSKRKDVSESRQGEGRRSSRGSDDRRRAKSIGGDAAKQSGKSKLSKKSGGIVRRIRSLSRSRSSSSKQSSSGFSSEEMPRTIVTVTSCRSDGYHNQKAPGATSKLPRKAPTNLKLFHELAVGIKDAYTAVGKTPTKPVLVNEDTGERMNEVEFQQKSILWEFLGNVDFLLALVDEVAVDTATRGALKDDKTFKGVRDVIKKCNKVLEEMLVRRERRYTLFFRLPEDPKDIARIKAWNEKVEKAVGAVTDTPSIRTAEKTDSESDTSSISSASTGGGSKAPSVFARGRQLLPTAGRVRARRATPTPTLRRRTENGDDSSGNAAEDGFAASAPVTQGNLAALQRSLHTNDSNSGSIPSGLMEAQPSQQLAPQQQIAPKDELVDVIRGLRMEKIKNREMGSQESDLIALKPDWRPKADIPSSVPKLPTEYIHRHRLMKQVVSCLLDQVGAGPRDVDEEASENAIITSITSRHGDKAGNGKTILAVAAIQTVEVRERFSDGIAWVQLGRGPLSERDIRRLYEEIYRQLVIKGTELEDDPDEEEIRELMATPSGGSSFDGGDKAMSMEQRRQSSKEEAQRPRLVALAEMRRRFQGGELEGMKEDLGRLLANKKYLICLDDVWRVEDAKWFIFENQIMSGTKQNNVRRRRDAEDIPGRVLITTRMPNLLGPGLVQEVFVRILTEHEAVKLLLSTAGRRPYGGKNSEVFNQAKLVVKGCGNSPLAVRLAGSMLRHSSRSWNLSSPAWAALIHQCRLNLEEASQLRSFVNAVKRVVDLSFFDVTDVRTRIALRRCFVAFAMAFRDNDWALSGRGIPQSVVLRVFKTVIPSGKVGKSISSVSILNMMENLNLIERARHGLWTASNLRMANAEHNLRKQDTRGSEDNDSDWEEDEERTIHRIQQFYVMHDSLKGVAEEMAKRSTPSLSPDPDDFTSYFDKIADEKKAAQEYASVSSSPFRFLSNPPAPSESESEKSCFTESEAHRIVVIALLEVGDGLEDSTSMAEVLKARQIDMALIPGGDKMEEYVATFLPSHLMRFEAYGSAAEILSDTNFINRRAHALGIVEATSRQVADLQELRRVAGNASLTLYGKRVVDVNGVSTETNGPVRVDVNSVVRDGSRIIIDEVLRIANKQDGAPDSLGMAMCLAAVGEGLLKARQPSDAMLRLEEAVGLFRGLLGPFHTFVADALHAAAKALVKVGETRVALLKFAEAARIYEACKATLYYNSIANAQSLASLLVDLGDMEKAQSMFEEVISMRRSVYGENCVPVAKTINSYAILQAKHGRMNLALQNYEAAKVTYQSVPIPLIQDPEFEVKCKYDVTLINLNIASIRSKKGELQAAISCYEDGVQGLREYETAFAELLKDPLRSHDIGKNTAHKHLIAALGRIGSLKLKVNDNPGALQAYMTLLTEVKEDSPAASKTEKAKAHIKCATIYRQQDNSDSHVQSIAHLREALNMYTAIFGPDHKDTAAIASSLRQWLSEDHQQ